MKSNLPIFEFLITDDETDMSGVSAFSLVSKPAIKSDFMKFNAVIPAEKYIFIQKDEKKYKGIVAGIAMKPNELIPRVNDKGEKFYGYFSPETIEKIREKYHKNVENLTQVNLEHNEKTPVKAYLLESYILDTPEMVNAVRAKGIKEATLGSWYTAFKIEDKEVFEKCLKGEFNGFSVEAFLMREMRDMETKNNFSVLNIEKKMKKTIIQKFKERLDSLIEEMSFKEALVPELNIKLTWGSVGDEVTKTYQDTEGNEKTEAVGAGEFVIEDGRTIVTDDNSALLEIREKPAEEMAKEEEMPEEEMPEEEKKEEEEEKKEEEEEKKEEEEEKPVEDMPVSGDTKQKKTKEEICAECPDCPECLEEEDMMVEEEFAPDGNTNACKHGGRSTDASGYCNGMGSAEKSTGTYKQGKKVKKQEDKPAEKKEEAPKEAPKAEEKKVDAPKPKDIGKPEEKPVEVPKVAEEKVHSLANPRHSKDDWKALYKQQQNATTDSEKEALAKKRMQWYIDGYQDQIDGTEDLIKRNPKLDGEVNRGFINGWKKEQDRLKKAIENKEWDKYMLSSEEFSMIQEDFSALQTENEALKAEVAALKVKLSEPIAEPKLKDVEIKGEVKELSVYELVARRNGLPTV